MEIQARSWEDKEGQKRWTTEIRARDVRFLGGRGDQDGGAGGGSGGGGNDFGAPPSGGDSGGDVPF